MGFCQYYLKINMKPKVNDKAPDFDLPDQYGKDHKLEDYIGEWFLLYFYPKDNTPGCTTEACSFRDNISKFKNKLTIVGVSGDSVKSHIKFSDKYKLPFTILSDSDKKIIRKYGANGVIFPKRTSFLIDPGGFIAKIYEKVDPTIHYKEILEDVSKFV